MDDGVTKRDVLKAAAGLGAVGVTTGSVTAERTTRTDSAHETRYIVGINSASDSATPAVEEAKLRATSTPREIDLGSVRQLVVGEFESDDVATLRSMSGVEYVEPDRRYSIPRPQPAPEPQTADGTTDSTPDYPWGIERLDANHLHELGYTGEGATIAVLDSGVDPTHPAVDGTIEAGTAIGDVCR